MEGYNISTTINGKTILGRTQDNLTITAKIKESLTKDDAGVTRKRVTGHDAKITANGLCILDTASAEATKLDRDDVLELVLKTGDDAVFPVVYGATDSAKYKGDAIISDFSEDSNSSADADPSWSMTIQFTTELTKVV